MWTRRRLFNCCVASIFVGLTLGTISSSLATHDDFVGCNVVTDQTSPPTYHFGDERKNHCLARGGQDSMWGYGARDILGAGAGNDKARGANGNDDLNDTAGSGDRDRACDGAGDDTVDHFEDPPNNDGNDHFHRTDQAGFDTYIRNLGDDPPHNHSGDCPAGVLD